jgi:hypothetical protein
MPSSPSAAPVSNRFKFSSKNVSEREFNIKARRDKETKRQRDKEEEGISFQLNTLSPGIHRKGAKTQKRKEERKKQEGKKQDIRMEHLISPYSSSFVIAKQRPIIFSEIPE